jgi:predicted DCC family thiol-disulfide oxidoreductase YuxK
VRPVLIYDGDCGFCRTWVGRFRRITGAAINYAPSQQAAASFPQIAPEKFDESVWLVEPEGRITGAAEAVCRTFALAGKYRWMLWGYEHLPGLAKLAESIYRLVAHNRGTADQIDRWLLPDPADTTRSYALTRSIFLRGLALVYLAAFLSLWVQIDGLIGSRGILPVTEYLAQVDTPDQSFLSEFFHLPTLCWINSSDQFLHVLLLGGAVLSGMLVLGLFPLPILVLLWLFYLSLVNVGQVFLGYQWDALLLETGFLAIFLAPISWRIGGTGGNPSRIVLFLLRWLLFRLIILSGLVKLLSGDQTWRGLTALHYHYQTQPLPTWTAWYANLAPTWFQAFSVLLVLFIEILVPVFFFSRRSRRLFACALAVLLQILIGATGNYGFFNLLTIVQCITLIDDAAWERVLWFLPKKLERETRGREMSPFITVPLLVLLFPLTLVPAFLSLGLRPLIPPPLEQAWIAVGRFESINAYGLFATMTTTRPELFVEGSDDGKTWIPYEFKWKPGEVTRRPQFCTPHMPRLDWQMWFAALNVERGELESWVPMFLDRLREGSPPVLGLMGTNPFPDHPPRQIRVRIYQYQFTTYSQRSSTGAWWRREYVGELPAGANP